MPLVWPCPIDWECPAGKLLTALGHAIPPERKSPILVFGSAALQLTVAPTILSADADVAPDIDTFDPQLTRFPRALDRQELSEVVRRSDLGPAQNRLYLHVCSRDAFDPGTKYLRRLMELPRGNMLVVVPHPIDILVAKLHRYDAKDQADFKEVYQKAGFPNADELLSVLRSAYRVFNQRSSAPEHMPTQFDASNITENTPKVFRDLYGQSVSVKRDILEYARREIESSYRSPAHLAQLAALADQPLAKPADPQDPTPSASA